MFFNKLKGFVYLSAFLFLVTVTVTAKLNVVAITPDFGSIAKEVGGNKIAVKVLLTRSQDLHDVYPKPSMVYKVKNADLLIRLGLGQDSWIDSLVEVARNNKVFKHKQGHIDCSKEIDVLEVPSGNIDGRFGDVHKEGNPHYWLNPENAKIIAQQISNALQKIDPENRAYYQKNTQTFIGVLDSKITQWKNSLASFSKLNLVTYHKNWSYLIDAFDLNLVGYIEPFPGVAPSPKHLKTLIADIKSKKNPVYILVADFYSEKAPQYLAEKTNSKLIVLATHTRSDQSYLQFIESIVNTLKDD